MMGARAMIARAPVIVFGVGVEVVRGRAGGQRGGDEHGARKTGSGAGGGWGVPSLESGDGAGREAGAWKLGVIGLAHTLRWGR